MKGFGIYVKNNLLEPKHVEKFGANPLFLYLWLLDKMTSVNENGVGKVLGNLPITHAKVQVDLGIDDRTYRRWIKRLKDEGYINTIRAPHGLVITVNKAEKIFKKRPDKNVLSPRKSSDKSDRTDRTNLSKSSDKSGTSNIRQYKDNTVDNTKDTITNVIEAKASYGKPEINELFDFWEETVGYKISTHVQKNRNACQGLLKSQGMDNIKRFIIWINLAQADRFATKEAKAADFIDLRHNLKHLLVWAKGKAMENNAAARF